MLRTQAREELAEVLALCHGARIEHRGPRVRVAAADEAGFDVSLINDPPDSIVCFAGWHATLCDPESAVRLFALGLSTDCRLTIERIGHKPRRWLIERRDGASGSWHEIGETSLLMLRLWRTPRSRRLQNSWLPGAWAGSKQACSPARQGRTQFSS